MGKISFDKYYTPPIVARWCIEKTKEIIGEENITEWIEPSAGSGSFSHQIDGCKAYDLYPQHEYIEQADFLELDLGGYKKGRCFIGNPPFGGNTGKLIKDFYNKCCDNGDYIAFILPASYYNSYGKLYQFEIVYSCLLETPYTNEVLKTSFTIYKRNPDKNDFRENKESELQDVTLIQYGRKNNGKNKKVLPHDYCFIRFGDILKKCEPYGSSGFITVKCNNENNRKDIIEFFKWLYYYNKETKILNKKSISAPSLCRYDLIKLLKICIPGIK